MRILRSISRTRVSAMIRNTQHALITDRSCKKTHIVILFYTSRRRTMNHNATFFTQRTMPQLILQKYNTNQTLSIIIYVTPIESAFPGDSFKAQGRGPRSTLSSRSMSMSMSMSSAVARGEKWEKRETSCTVFSHFKPHYSLILSTIKGHRSPCSHSLTTHCGERR